MPGYVLTSDADGLASWQHLDTIIVSSNSDAFNINLQLVGNTLRIQDGGGTLAANLSSLIDDADADPANETITNFAIVGNQIQLTEAGNTHSITLNSLNDGDTTSSNELITNVLLLSLIHI